MAMTNLREQPVGKLKITCSEVTATYFMPSFLHGFTTQFPGIAIELIATNRHLNIIRERVDFAFRVGTTTGQDIIIRRISFIKRVLVAAPAFLASGILFANRPICSIAAAWCMMRNPNGYSRRTTRRSFYGRRLPRPRIQWDSCCNPASPETGLHSSPLMCASRPWPSAGSYNYSRAGESHPMK
ncbi:LysR substrate-binding domain-containing protein [Mesorhizobium sp. M0904]